MRVSSYITILLFLDSFSFVSAFLHFYLKDENPISALDSAQLFAALKIRHAGAAEGFVSEAELEESKC